MGRYFQTNDPKYRDYSYQHPKEDMYLALDQEMKAKGIEDYTRNITSRLDNSTFSHFSGDLNDELDTLDGDINSLVDAFKSKDPQAEAMLRDLKNTTRKKFSNEGEIGVLSNQYQNFKATKKAIFENEKVDKGDANLWLNHQMKRISSMKSYKDLKGASFSEVPEYYDLNAELKKYMDSEKFKQTFSSYFKKVNVPAKNADGTLKKNKKGDQVYETQSQAIDAGSMPEFMNLPGFEGWKAGSMKVDTIQYNQMQEAFATQLMLQNDPKFTSHQQFRYDMGQNSLNIYDEKTQDYENKEFDNFNDFLAAKTKQIGLRQSLSHTDLVSRKESFEVESNDAVAERAKQKNRLALEDKKLANKKKYYDYEEDAKKEAESTGLPTGVQIASELERLEGVDKLGSSFLNIPRLNNLTDFKDPNNVKNVNDLAERQKAIGNYISNLKNKLSSLVNAGIINSEKYKELIEKMSIVPESGTKNTQAGSVAFSTDFLKNKGKYPLAELDKLGKQYRKAVEAGNITTHPSLIVPPNFMTTLIGHAITHGTSGNSNINLRGIEVGFGQTIPASTENTEIVSIDLLPNGKMKVKVRPKSGHDNVANTFSYSAVEEEMVLDWDPTILKDYVTKGDNGELKYSEKYKKLQNKNTIDFIDMAVNPVSNTIQHNSTQIRKIGVGDSKTLWQTKKPIAITNHGGVTFDYNIDEEYGEMNVVIPGQQKGTEIYEYQKEIILGKMDKILESKMDVVTKSSSYSDDFKREYLDILSAVQSFAKGGGMNYYVTQTLGRNSPDIGLYEQRVKIFNETLHEIIAQSKHSR